MIYQLEDRRVRLIGDEHFIAPSASIVGSVTLSNRCSVWFGAVIRGDLDPIFIDEETNIQDGAVLHADPGFPLHVGRRVTVGHKAMLHGATIGDGALIGINAVILNGATIGKNTIIGANALVAEGKVIPENSLAVGSPARVVRKVTDEDLANLDEFCNDYLEKIKRYRSTFRPDHGIRD
ncbi:MAG: gamma carbonic anhydrase family protein [Pseudomonadota bacterium]